MHWHLRPGAPRACDGCKGAPQGPNCVPSTLTSMWPPAQEYLTGVGRVGLALVGPSVSSSTGTHSLEGVSLSLGLGFELGR